MLLRIIVILLGLGLPCLADDVTTLARSAGEPQITGLRIVYLTPLGDPARAPWRHIIVHQTEGPAGSARNGAYEQAKTPTRRGVTLWVETDGTVYWALPETFVALHGDGFRRNDNRYIDNTKTLGVVAKENAIGVEFAGNFPNVATAPTEAQRAAWLLLARFLMARYGIPVEHIYAHNWVDFKDARYCEGCALAEAARAAANGK